MFDQVYFLPNFVQDCAKIGVQLIILPVEIMPLEIWADFSELHFQQDEDSSHCALIDRPPRKCFSTKLNWTTKTSNRYHVHMI